MASFLTSLGPPSCSSLTWSSVLRKSTTTIESDAFLHNTSGNLGFKRGSSGIVVKGKGVRMMAVKAIRGGVGTPKFKRTVMKKKQLTEMIEKKVVEAKKVEDKRSEECKVAWDEVEEVSQAKADLRMKQEKQDPLEYYCQDNPETDECRIYED